jgi:WD40 repeat protein
VKLSGKATSTAQALWIAAHSTLAVCSAGDGTVRLWDMARDDHCTLSLTTDKGYTPGDTIRVLAYCARRGTLTIQ